MQEGGKGGGSDQLNISQKLENTFNCVNFIFHCGYLLPFLARSHVHILRGNTGNSPLT